MPQEINMNQQMSQGMAPAPPKKEAAAAPAESQDGAAGNLDQVFDLIFSSSKQVLGNISSIGIKYGKNLAKPDHMLVVFPQEVYGFEAWNSQQKRRWRYQRSNKVISKNGVAGSEHDEQSFVAFVQRGLDAMNEQNVEFSKNITQKELQGVK